MTDQVNAAVELDPRLAAVDKELLVAQSRVFETDKDKVQPSYGFNRARLIENAQHVSFNCRDKIQVVSELVSACYLIEMLLTVCMEKLDN